MADRNVRKGFDAFNSRKSRGSEVDSLRKKKRDDVLTKMSSEIEDIDFRGAETTIDEAIFDNCQRPEHPDDYVALVLGLQSPDPTTHLQAAYSLRLGGALNRADIFQHMVNAGALPLVINHIATSQSPRMQLECAWLLTNIASCDRFTTTVIQNGAIPVIMRAVSSGPHSVACQAAWCLGNFANEGDTYKKLFLKEGMHDCIGRLLIHPETTTKHIQTLSWAIGSIIRFQIDSAEALELHHTAQSVVPVLAASLRRMDMTSNDKEVLAAITDIFFAVSYASEGNDEDIKATVDAGFIPICIQFLYTSTRAAGPAARIIGNITSCDDNIFSDIAIKGGILAALQYCLTSEKSYLRKEALWALSNVCAGTSEQLTALLSHGILTDIIAVLKRAEAIVKEEASYCILNFACNASREQIEVAVNDMDLLQILSDQLRTSNRALFLKTILDSIKYIFEAIDSPYNPYVDTFAAAKGEDRLQAMSHHPKREINQRADYLIETYFANEEEAEFDEDEEFNF
ncbi:Armadillo/beta-catenin-like repeat [Carpediemonas membranifera]|uniref:Importin subunit alpha n=1 Tax=Carpediemonas membranifera TaxID=201153 RepID=A0A8J6E117_9EUKA|nr:Armadillo/beta-catenin-like repeat [Carpediemonas membranifera]|eukprot:KAG9395784.1 Armadillo/beta-catenin-like repeat [Carpediemonas membranifera]